MKDCGIIKISDESIRKFKEIVAMTDKWMLYYFNIYISFGSEIIECESQIFLDIPNIINSIDNLLLFQGKGILFDSGGKYSIGFEYIDKKHIKLWAQNDKEKYEVLEMQCMLKNIFSLLMDIRDICLSVKQPSRELLYDIRLINTYLHILKFYEKYNFIEMER